MNQSIFIGIDMGSTGLKAVAFDGASGATLAVAGRALPFRRLAGGGCELAAEDIELALVWALRSVASQLQSRVAHVRALSCTGHGAGLYVLDARQRLVQGRAVASTDQRAGARARALALSAGAMLYQEVGCQPWAGQSSLIVAELCARHAIHREEIHHLFFAKDYLTLLLTGEIATDASDASTAGLLSLSNGTWSRRALEAAGVGDLLPTALPPIMGSGEVVGHLLPARAVECGLPSATPVVISAIDLLASLAAVGASQRGQAVAVLGTWCVNAVVDATRERQPEVGGIVNFGVSDRRLYLENSPSSMANISWLARVMGFESPAHVVECAMSVPLGAEGVRFLPFVNGASSPAEATAGFIGLQSHHGRPHMARAVVDAVAALHARHLTRLSAAGLGVPGQVAALGGGARDVRLVHLIACFVGHPLERCGDDETGARGAALYAALSQQCAMPPPVFEVVEHDALDAQRYADHYSNFHELIDQMSPAFSQQAETYR